MTLGGLGCDWGGGELPPAPGEITKALSKGGWLTGDLGEDWARTGQRARKVASSSSFPSTPLNPCPLPSYPLPSAPSSPLPPLPPTPQIGDHVRVLAGAHKGETGMVVQVERGVCAVVGDATRAQFRVNARDLTEDVEKAPGLEVRGARFFWGVRVSRGCGVWRGAGVSFPRRVGS